ncbi:MAG: FAD-binding oxidoreductase [Salinisphaera sp.]|jgi:FAD/FMN-containing dehydrogenase|nr:FAD-binding oxidoreductase [Salinisphaera sp.]
MPESMNPLLSVLREALGEQAVCLPESAGDYLREWRGAFEPTALAVVFPATTEQVSIVLRCCSEHDCAVVPQSGNTGLVGGAAATDAERHVLLNLERMDRIREIDADNATMTVEAGCTLADAQRAAAAAGFLLPIQLASRERCRIGGNLASNAGGLNVVYYGNTRDRVLGLEVVLANGRVWHNLSGLRKDNSGYDLNDLFVGSEGTLGIITAAVLELADLPQQRAVAWCGLDHPQQAVKLARRIGAASGGQIVGCELICAQILDLACTHMDGCEPPLVKRHPWNLLVEIASSAPGDWLAPILSDALAAACEAGQVVDYQLATAAADIDRLWHLRESLPPAQTAEGASIKHDISLPVSRLPAFLETALAAVNQALPGIRPCPFGHVGDGNLHFNLTRPVDMADEVFKAEAARLHRLVHDLAIDMGGSIAAEHGVGRLKVAELQRTKQAVELDMLARIKQALDPDNQLNPGVVVDLGASAKR